MSTAAPPPAAAAAAAAAADRAPLRHTPLHDLHIKNGARMVPFAGYDMPLHYQPGLLKEHLHTRSAAGLFEVSHMGQIAIWPKSAIEETALALERLVPADVVEIAPGRQRYALLTAANGGILDDIMIANLGTHFVVIVNAATKEADLVYLRANMPAGHTIEMLADRALVALQGPGAEHALAAAHAPAIRAMRFMAVAQTTIGGIGCVVSRSGYTGEDGFEISVPAERAEDLVRMLLCKDGVALVGLGARDSLRLEAGLCLYGSDIDDTTTPVEAALEWSIQKSRQTGGKRAGGFPGAEVVLAQLAAKPPRRRVGLRPEGRAPLRAGALIYGDQISAQPVGRITSGGYGPSLSAPIAMGYVEEPASANGTRLFADVRGVRRAAAVVPLPFVPHRYRRN